MLDIPLPTLSCVGQPHRHLAELEGSPRRQHGRLVPVVLMDAEVVVGLKDVQFGEDGGSFDVVSKRSDGGKRKSVQDGPEVDQTEVTAATVTPIRL